MLLGGCLLSSFYSKNLDQRLFITLRGGFFLLPSAYYSFSIKKLCYMYIIRAFLYMKCSGGPFQTHCSYLKTFGKSCIYYTEPRQR